jgi:hypothetical protein
MKPKVVRLSDVNYNFLASLAHPGQSLDGVLTELFTRYNLLPKPDSSNQTMEQPNKQENGDGVS